jgi:hypothetical protein
MRKRKRPGPACRVCHRALRSLESIAAGIGPVCAKRHQAKEAADEEALRAEIAEDARRLAMDRRFIGLNEAHEWDPTLGQLLQGQPEVM